MGTIPDLKALKKLVIACRKTGIKQFKCAEYEFSLTDSEPSSTIRKSRIVAKLVPTLMQQALSAEDLDFESDAPTEDELLFYSVSNLPEETPKS